jgi:hypothetical protein
MHIHHTSHRHRSPIERTIIYDNDEKFGAPLFAPLIAFCVALELFRARSLLLLKQASASKKQKHK